MIVRHDTLEAFLSWASAQLPRLAMQAELVDFAPAIPHTGQPIGDSVSDTDWVVGSDGLGRPDGRYFTVKAVHVGKAAGREVTGWDQPMIAGDGKGYILLVEDEDDEQILVRLKAEPGNDGMKLEDGSNSFVLVSPPFQASQANMDKHGAKVPLLSLAQKHQEWEPAPEDGGRFYLKVNNYGSVSANAKMVDAEITSSPTPGDFAWISMEVFRELRKRGFVNGHLRSVVSLLA